MGSTQSSYQQRFYKKYNFIQQLYDKNYGLIKVYRKKEVNFDYVMLMEKLIPKNHLQNTKSELQQIKGSFANERCPMLLRVFNVEQFQKTNCGGYGLKIYMQYLNYSLKDEIDQKKSLMQSFHIEEVMYILQSAIETFHLFNQFKQNCLVIRSDTIFITVEGFLRFSPIRVLDYQEEEFDSCQCMMEPTVKNYFAKSERQFLIQLKNLLHQLVSICPRNDPNFVRSYQLLSNVNRSKTLSSIKGWLWQPNIEGLNVAKKIPQSTEISTVRQPLTGSFQQSAARSKRSLRDSSHLHNH